MMDATEVAAAELLLQNADFPDHYVDMQHPDDYSAVDHPFVEYITNLMLTTTVSSSEYAGN